jgi:hypothetical protein
MSLQAASNVILFPHRSVIDMLWWPSNPVKAGLSLVGRAQAEHWCDDLHAAGIVNGDVVEFLREEVLERFTLTVNADGSGQWPCVEVPRGASVSTDSGDCCDSIDELISYCHEQHKWSLPLTHKCRVGIQSRVQMRMLRRSNGKFGLFCEGKAT